RGAKGGGGQSLARPGIGSWNAWLRCMAVCILDTQLVHSRGGAQCRLEHAGGRCSQACFALSVSVVWQAPPSPRWPCASPTLARALPAFCAVTAEPINSATRRPPAGSPAVPRRPAERRDRTA